MYYDYKIPEIIETDNHISITVRINSVEETYITITEQNIEEYPGSNIGDVITVYTRTPLYTLNEVYKSSTAMDSIYEKYTNLVNTLNG